MAEDRRSQSGEGSRDRRAIQLRGPVRDRPRQPEMGARCRRVRAARRGAGAPVRDVPRHHAGERGE